MSGGFKMDTDLVNTSGNNINTNGSNFQGEVSAFANHVSAICGIWTGADADEFNKVATELKGLLDQASITVQDVGSHLVKTAGAVNENVEANVSRMSGI